MFRYNDCVNREATVRGRIKLHLKVAVQPYVKEGAYPDFSEKIGKMLSRACRLKDGKSVRIPVVHDGRKLLVFKFER